MTEPIIIMLCGKKGSGKTTLARDVKHYIKMMLNTNAVFITSYAKPIRSAFKIMFNHIGEWQDLDRDTKECYRPFFQTIGDVCRQLEPNYFALRMLDSIYDIEDAFSDKTPVIIIDDLRYFDEYRVVKESFPESVIVVKIVSDQEINDDNHSSEAMTGLDEIVDFVFFNKHKNIEKDAEALYKALFPYIEKLKK